MENSQEVTENIWNDILDKLFVLDYSQLQAITEMERKVYQELQKKPQSVEGLITLMFVQIMLGNHDKATDIGHKIWGIGGSITPFFELLYTDNLLNLGLLDMASVLLKSRFAVVETEAEYFYPVMIKFALMTGNISLIERLSGISQEAEEDADLFDLADVYSRAGYGEHFKNIHKIIAENYSGHLCSYDYDLFSERGFPEIEIILYVNPSDTTAPALESQIENKISAYWSSSSVERLNNLSVSVRDIKSHPAWQEETEEEE